MTFFAALILALSALFNMGAQAPITAPSQALTFEAPHITTQPAPKATQAPSQALSQAPVEAPSQAPTQAPICEEDMPCWDCHTMGNLICGNEAPQAPVGTECMEDMPCWDCATMGNLICGPAATEAPVQAVQAPVTCPADTLLAEDGSCVNAHFWDAVYTDDAATDAWDSFDHVPATLPGHETKVEYTGTTNDAAAPMQPTEFMIPSIHFPNTFHIFQITYIPLTAA